MAPKRYSDKGKDRAPKRRRGPDTSSSSSEDDDNRPLRPFGPTREQLREAQEHVERLQNQVQRLEILLEIQQTRTTVQEQETKEFELVWRQTLDQLKRAKTELQEARDRNTLLRDEANQFLEWKDQDIAQLRRDHSAHTAEVAVLTQQLNHTQEQLRIARTEAEQGGERRALIARLEGERDEYQIELAQVRMDLNRVQTAYSVFEENVAKQQETLHQEAIEEQQRAQVVMEQLRAQLVQVQADRDAVLQQVPEHTQEEIRRLQQEIDELRNARPPRQPDDAHTAEVERLRHRIHDLIQTQADRPQQNQLRELHQRNRHLADEMRRRTEAYENSSKRIRELEGQVEQVNRMNDVLQNQIGEFMNRETDELLDQHTATIQDTIREALERTDPHEAFVQLRRAREELQRVHLQLEETETRMQTEAAIQEGRVPMAEGMYALRGIRDQEDYITRVRDFERRLRLENDEHVGTVNRLHLQLQHIQELRELENEEAAMRHHMALLHMSPIVGQNQAFRAEVLDHTTRNQRLQTGLNEAQQRLHEAHEVLDRVRDAWNIRQSAERTRVLNDTEHQRRNILREETMEREGLGDRMRLQRTEHGGRLLGEVRELDEFESLMHREREERPTPVVTAGSSGPPDGGGDDSSSDTDDDDGPPDGGDDRGRPSQDDVPPPPSHEQNELQTHESGARDKLVSTQAQELKRLYDTLRREYMSVLEQQQRSGITREQEHERIQVSEESHRDRMELDEATDYSEIGRIRTQAEFDRILTDTLLNISDNLPGDDVLEIEEAVDRNQSELNNHLESEVKLRRAIEERFDQITNSIREEFNQALTNVPSSTSSLVAPVPSSTNATTESELLPPPVPVTPAPKQGKKAKTKAKPKGLAQFLTGTDAAPSETVPTVAPPRVLPTFIDDEVPLIPAVYTGDMVPIRRRDQPGVRWASKVNHESNEDSRRLRRELAALLNKSSNKNTPGSNTSEEIEKTKTIPGMTWGLPPTLEGHGRYQGDRDPFNTTKKLAGRPRMTVEARDETTGQTFIMPAPGTIRMDRNRLPEGIDADNHDDDVVWFTTRIPFGNNRTVFGITTTFKHFRDVLAPKWASWVNSKWGVDDPNYPGLLLSTDVQSRRVYPNTSQEGPISQFIRLRGQRLTQEFLEKYNDKIRGPGQMTLKQAKQAQRIAEGIVPAQLAANVAYTRGITGQLTNQANWERRVREAKEARLQALREKKQKQMMEIQAAEEAQQIAHAEAERQRQMVEEELEREKKKWENFDPHYDESDADLERIILEEMGEAKSSPSPFVPGPVAKPSAPVNPFLVPGSPPAAVVVTGASTPPDLDAPVHARLPTPPESPVPTPKPKPAPKIDAAHRRRIQAERAAAAAEAATPPTIGAAPIPGGEAPVGEMPRDMLDVPGERQSIFADLRGAFVRSGVHGRMQQVRPLPVGNPWSEIDDDDETESLPGQGRERALMDQFSENFELINTVTGPNPIHQAEYRRLIRSSALEYAARELRGKGYTLR